MSYLDKLTPITQTTNTSKKSDYMSKLQTSKPNLEELRAREAAFKKEAERSTTSRFIEALPGAAADVLIKGPARFAASAALAPVDIARQSYGLATNQNIKPISTKLPFVGESFQSEAAKKQQQIVDNEAPMYEALTPFAQVPLVGIEAATLPGLAKSTKGAINPLIKMTRNAAHRTIEKRSVEKSVAALTPKFKPTELEDVSMKKGGFFAAPKVDMSKDKEFMDVATSLKGIVKGKSAIEDKNILQTAIEKTSDEVVRPFLSANPVQTYFGDFIKKLELTRPKTSLKSGTPQFENYNRAREEIINRVANYLRSLPNKGSITDMNDYWDARKMIDDVLDTETKGKVFGDPVREGIVAAGQDMRRAMKEYILDALQYPGQMDKVNKIQDILQTMRSRGIDIPSEKEAVLQLQRQLGVENAPEDVIRAAFFQDQMEMMTKMYKGIDYIKTKIPAEFKQGSTLRQIFKNPITQTIGAGTIGAGLIGAGGSLIE